MLSRTVPFSDLLASGRWRADLHVHKGDELKSSKYDMVTLGEVVQQSKKAIDPKDINSSETTYIGLENVSPVTGDPVGITDAAADSVKSRSKIFAPGDVLYGRLRPYLRKALFVESPLSNGICSTEFLVLQADKSRILPEFLRELLVSEPVTEHLTRMQGGAALPRVSAKDLLGLSVPLPPIDEQKKIVQQLRHSNKKRKELLQKVEDLTGETQNLVVNIFS